MAGEIKTFDFRNTLLTFGGVEIDGYAKGSDSISVEYNENAGELEVDASGSNGLHVVNSDQSGKVTVKLQQSSDSVPFLQQAFKLAKQGSDAMYQPLFLHDLNSGEKIQLSPAYVYEAPSRGYGSESSDVEFVLMGLCLEQISAATFQVTATA